MPELRCDGMLISPALKLVPWDEHIQNQKNLEHKKRRNKQAWEARERIVPLKPIRPIDELYSLMQEGFQEGLAQLQAQNLDKNTASSEPSKPGFRL